MQKSGKIEEARQVNTRLKMLREKKAHNDTEILSVPDSPKIHQDNGEVSHSNPTPPRKPILAALLSFIIPGLGQIYNREYLKGILFFIFTIIGSFFLIIPGLIIWVVGIYDAYRTAKQINSGEILSKSSRKKTTTLFFGIIAAIFSFLIIAAIINGLSGPVYESVNVIVTPTPDGMTITWNGGMDFDQVIGWKVFDSTSGEEFLLIDGTGNIPPIGQINTYSGGSISGKLIIIRVWFSDGTEQVVFDRQF